MMEMFLKAIVVRLNGLLLLYWALFQRFLQLLQVLPVQKNLLIVLQGRVYPYHTVRFLLKS